jgi:hypothetical protein
MARGAEGGVSTRMSPQFLPNALSRSECRKQRAGGDPAVGAWIVQDGEVSGGDMGACIDRCGGVFDWNRRPGQDRRHGVTRQLARRHLLGRRGLLVWRGQPGPASPSSCRLAEGARSSRSSCTGTTSTGRRPLHCCCGRWRGARTTTRPGPASPSSCRLAGGARTSRSSCTGTTSANRRPLHCCCGRR